MLNVADLEKMSREERMKAAQALREQATAIEAEAEGITEQVKALEAKAKELCDRAYTLRRLAWIADRPQDGHADGADGKTF